MHMAYHAWALVKCEQCTTSMHTAARPHALSREPLRTRPTMRSTVLPESADALSTDRLTSEALLLRGKCSVPAAYNEGANLANSGILNSLNNPD